MSKLKEEELSMEFLKQLKNTFNYIISLLEEGISTNKKARMELDYIEKQIIEREINANVKKRPEVTEEWIEEKALELNNEVLLESYGRNYYKVAKDFIRSLVKEITKEAK